MYEITSTIYNADVQGRARRTQSSQFATAPKKKLKYTQCAK